MSVLALWCIIQIIRVSWRETNTIWVPTYSGVSLLPELLVIESIFFIKGSSSWGGRRALAAARSWVRMLEQTACLGGLIFAIRSGEVLEDTSSLQAFNVEPEASIPMWYKNLCTPWITLIFTYAKKSTHSEIILCWLCVPSWILPCLNIPFLEYLLCSLFGMVVKGHL